jgi:hypothetical protein
LSSKLARLGTADSTIDKFRIWTDDRNGDFSFSRSLSRVVGISIISGNFESFFR